MRREIASHTARTMATCLVWIEEFEAEVSSWSNPIKSIKWDIRREGRRWSNEEFDQRLYRAPEKIEFVNGIFASEQERFNVLRLYYVAKMFTPARRIPLLGFRSVVRLSPTVRLGCLNSPPRLGV
jgi:hypothetical protein